MTEDLVQNRYRLLGKLGKGGMGSVYKAEDTQSPGRIIALKRIGLGDGGSDKLPYLRHEFTTLVELQHRNLAEVHDFGEIPDRKEWFFTSEFIDGVDLLEAAQDLDWDELMDVVVQICHALEYIHSRDIIHYDVKPKNILVRKDDDGRPIVKIVDFGLSLQGTAPAGGRIRGTVHYLAPEIIRGDAVDGRADLYSLGATLFHVVTGRPPFEGDTSISIIRQHLHSPPPISEELREDIPSTFSTLVRLLLAKSPADRIQTANQVIRGVNRESERQYPLEPQESTGTLFRGCFVGRTKELRELSQALSARVRGDPEAKTLVLVEGSGGVGKSRLLRELQVQCQVDGVPFLHGAAFEEGGETLGPLGEVIGDLLPLTEAAELHRAGDLSGGEILRRYEAVLARVAPDLVPSEPGRAPPTTGESEEKLTFHERLARFFLEALEDTPGVILLSGLHWAHEATVEFLEHLAGAAAEQRFLLIGSYRPDEIREAAVRESLARLAERDFCQVMRLGGIDRAGVALLVRSMLGTGEMPLGLIDQLQQGTGGNPFFIEEAMKDLVEAGTLHHSQGRWVLRGEGAVERPMPTKIREMVVHRIGRIPQRLREMLEVLATFERPATPHFLSNVGGFDPQLLPDDLRTLESEEFLSREGTEEGSRFWIAHTLVREVTYQEMDRARRKEIHGRIADHLMGRQTGASRGTLEALAHHLLRGPYPARSVPFLIAAGDRSRWLHADEAAARFYTEALSITGDDDPVTTLQLLEALGEIHQRVGRHDEAISLQEQMIRLADQQGDRLALGRAHLRIGEVRRVRGEYKEAALHGSIALATLRETGRQEEVTKALITVGLIQRGVGNPEEAIRSFQECLDIHRESGDTLGEATTLSHLGEIHWARGEQDKALQCHQESFRLREEAEDASGTAASLSELGKILWARGQYGGALDSLRRALSIRRDLGDPLAAAASLEQIGRVHGDRGEYSLALQASAESLKIRARVGNRPGVAGALAAIGRIYLTLSDIPVASHFQGQALAAAREVGDRVLEATVLCDTALCRLRGKDLAAARDLLRQSREVGEAAGRGEVDVMADCVTARLALLEGDAKEARARGDGIVQSGEASRSPRIAALGLLLRGEAGLVAGPGGGAGEDLGKALRLAEELGDPELTWRAGHAAGRLAVVGRRLEEAARLYRKAVSAIEGVAESLGEDARETYLSDDRKQKFRNDAIALGHLLRERGDP